MDNESFVAQIQDLVMQGQAALVHPFNDKVLAGQATRTDLAVLAVQVYHRGLFSARFAAANLARCPVPEVRRALLGVVNDEEAKLPGEPPSHCDMMLTFAAALGLDRDEVIHARPLPNTLVFIDTIMQLSEGHWLEGMSMRASEIVGPPLGPLWTDALQRHYGFQPAEIVWWTEHGEADVGHSNIAVEVYRRHVRDESERELALRGVERMLAAWRIFYDGIQQGALDAAAGRDVGFRRPLSPPAPSPP